MRKDLFLAAVENLLGSPFVYRGRSKEGGVDCAGVAILGFQAAGSTYDFPSDYTQSQEKGLLIDWLNTVGVQVSEPEPGDLLLLRYSGRPQHLAVVSADGKMIHALFGPRKVVKCSVDKKRLVAVFRPHWSE